MKNHYVDVLPLNRNLFLYLLFIYEVITHKVFLKYDILDCYAKLPGKKNSASYFGEHSFAIV